ncbi:hypothetical protein B484DRAFT_424839, partial [Ochromonadaceae sp. CCMP2298]
MQESTHPSPSSLRGAADASIFPHPRTAVSRLVNLLPDARKSALAMATTEMSDASLAHILQLMKKRTGDLVNKAEGKEILAETNMLLRNGLITDLLKNIRAEVSSLCIKKPQAQAQTWGAGLPDASSASPAVGLQSIRLKAEILFFTLYQTQVEEDEARELLSLIKFLSDFVAQKQAPSTQANPFGVGGGMEPEGPSLDWQPPLFSLLVILQLAHVGAMQQTTYLLRRDEDLQNQSVEELEVGNALPQVPGSRCGMEDAWLCDGARGFTCLAFAILRQPEVDLDQAPAADVEWFLLEACRARAYSYVRLC